jgi:protein involved in polysaccharide export with SLBB domain
MRVRVARHAMLLLATAVLAAPATAQAAGQDTLRTQATRAELQAEAAQLDQQAQTASDNATRTRLMKRADSIRERLRDGDFDVGDRIAIVVSGDSAMSDTAVVRTGRVIQLKNLPDIPLQGVLHSELQGYLTTQLAKYLKNPTVQVTPLVQVAIVGAVGKPGFYSMPADVTLSDAIMAAGGPTQTADLNKTVIKRDNEDRFSDKTVQRALASGLTLDQLGVRAGDQIVIAEKGKTDWVDVLRVGAILASVTIGVIALTRHH